MLITILEDLQKEDMILKYKASGSARVYRSELEHSQEDLCVIESP